MRFVLVITLALILLSSCTWPPGTDGPWERTEIWFDTVVRIVGYGPEDDVLQAIDDAFAEFERMESIFNVFDTTSELGRINNSSYGRPVRMSDDMASVLERSVLVAMQTDGAFDPTVGSVMRLWRDADGVPPPDEDINQALAHVGYKQLDLDFQTMTIATASTGMRLDLGGVAKGYAVDRAVDIMADRVSAGMIVAGGSIRMFGRRPGATGQWGVGIQHPRAVDEVIAEIMISGGAVDTSGDYHRFFKYDGERYHHIIDPTTGMPGRKSIAVTVVAPDAVTADALSTGLFVMGPEQGMELVESTGGIEALFVALDGSITTSSGFPGRVTIRQVDSD